MNRWARLLTAARLMLALIGIGAGLFPVAALAMRAGPQNGDRGDVIHVETRTGTTTFDVEVARTRSERERGLMYRTSLPDRRGMLFDFGADRDVIMWMKNTAIPLDMIFIEANGRVRRIEHNTTPESLRLIRSGGPVRSVLEVSAGTAQKYGIEPGDRIVQPVANGS